MTDLPKRKGVLFGFRYGCVLAAAFWAFLVFAGLPVLIRFLNWLT